MIDAEVHDHILRAAASVGEPLHEAIRSVGPLAVAPPAHASVADRLLVEVVNQQLSAKAALAIWTRIEAAAAGLMLAPRDLCVPAHAGLLRGCGVSANKVRALHAIAEAEGAGLLGPELAGLAHAERVARLCRIRGVGPWTADMVGIFHYLDPDIWPVGDVAAVGTLRRLTGCADTATVAAGFAPYRSILARYMWRVREAQAVRVGQAA
jgi:DNA-3-methyladenine glycosylase II